MPWNDINNICEVAPDCLECPLSRCKWDDLKWFRSMIAVARRVAVLDVTRGVRSPAHVEAVRLGVTARTVYRYRELWARMLSDLPPGDLPVFLRLAGVRPSAGSPTIEDLAE